MDLVRILFGEVSPLRQDARQEAELRNTPTRSCPGSARETLDEATLCKRERGAARIPDVAGEAKLPASLAEAGGGQEEEGKVR